MPNHPYPPGIGGHAEGFAAGMSLLGGLIGLLLLLAILAGTLFFLVRSGRIARPPWAARRPPEQAARQILAERFARGDIGPDEFMERASVLNWTPGVEATSPPKRPRRR